MGHKAVGKTVNLCRYSGLERLLTSISIHTIPCGTRKEDGTFLSLCKKSNEVEVGMYCIIDK